METKLHADPVVREEIITKYLTRKLDQGTAAQFEDHYLSCQECFEEVRATELLISGLGRSGIERTQDHDVTVVRFAAPAELTASSLDLHALARMVQAPNETKVLIDLSQVSRIDSAGLGMLMRCYTHAVKNAGTIKLLNPTSQVKRVLSITRIDSVVPTYDDENAALKSF
jgi:anti-sigma B factor antagonist